MIFALIIVLLGNADASASKIAMLAAKNNLDAIVPFSAAPYSVTQRPARGRDEQLPPMSTVHTRSVWIA